MLRGKLLVAGLLSLAMLGALSPASVGYPSISNDFVFVMDTSQTMGSNIQWLIDSYTSLVQDQIVPLADGPGQIRVAIVTFGLTARTILPLTDVYTNLDDILQHLSGRYIDRISESYSNASDGLDEARQILQGGTAFRKMILLSARYFANTWKADRRSVPCAQGFEGICARVAFQNACADANRDGFEIWGMEIDHLVEGELPALEDFPNAMRQCVARPDRFAQVGNAREFGSFAREMIKPGLTACVNVGFELDLDRNLNDRVDTNEFFQAMDFWVGGCVPDSTFFKIVDLWINGKPISSGKLHADGTALRAVLSADTLRVAAPGAGAIELSVFTLAGGKIYSRSQAGGSLIWRLQDQSGAPLANGIYLAQITSRSADGKLLKSTLQKILLLR